MQQKMDQGVSKQQFLNSQHVITKPATIQAYAACGKDGDIHSYGIDSFNTNVKVICKRGSFNAAPNAIKANPKPPISQANQLQAQAQVSQAQLSVAQGKTSCPPTVYFSGSIQTTAPMTVKYHLEDFKGNTTAEKSLSFNSAGIKPITASFGYNMNFKFQGWAKLVVTSPNNVQSAKAHFNIQCPNSPLAGGSKQFAPQTPAKQLQIQQAPQNSQRNGSRAEPQIKPDKPPRARPARVKDESGREPPRTSAPTTEDPAAPREPKTTEPTGR